MLPEQWCSFETELERVILETKSSTNGDTKNDEGKYCFKEKQFFINPMIRVKLRKSKTELKFLCRFVDVEVGEKMNVALAVCCGVRGRALAAHTSVCLLLFADYKLRSIYSHEKYSGSESTLIRIHSLEKKSIARPYSIYGYRAKYCIVVLHYKVL